MPIEVRLGRPGVTIHQSETILVADDSGEIHARSDHGLFCCDTRFLSQYQFLINGEKWIPIQVVPLDYFIARIYFTNPSLQEIDGSEIRRNALGFRIDRAVGGGMHEDLTL